MTAVLPPSAAGVVPAARSGVAPGEAGQRRIAQEFEAQVLGAMLQPMFSGAHGGAFGGGAGEAMWQPMLVTEFGKAFARAGGVGLTDHIVRALRQVQESGGER